MAIYRYQHGDRPLEGFTIQHGLGRGGFGEVYYAISDSGREVALKAVQNYEDVELRGIKHCMNLKNQHLVSIFDIKHSEQELPFVVMEYIDGPSLREILDSHPEGLGPEKAAFFLQEIVKGLAYLHDCGVVHRDLKPHNVFYEQGVVKIGDYSLSKVISTSHRSGHTVTVGTVHYMAPEISMGRYDHTVDIYALGVMLYEMLTGHPPFLGDSMGEVLMKHVAGDIDVSGIDEPFARVIKKALSKEPNDRYQSAQAMVDDLLGHADLQRSVNSMGPETLTVIAEKAMKAAKQPSPPPPPRREPAATAAYAASPASKKKDPYRYTFDARAAKHVVPAQLRAVKAKCGRLAGPKAALRFVFWGFVIAGTLFGCAIAADVGHPGPLVIVGIGWALIVAIRKRRRRWLVAQEQRFANQAQHAAQTPRSDEHATAQHDQPHVAPPHFAHAAYRSGPNRAIDESPYSRLVSLIMSCVVFLVPVAGLQRLYVGRVKSGLLWFFTFGLLGIGQIYDMVMIALGQFRDVDGKRVLSFTKEKVTSLKEPVNQYSAVVRQRWTESRVGFKLGNLLFNLLGAILLLIALAAGAIVSIDFPRAFASGAFGQEIQYEMARSGVHDWNIIVSAVLGMITVIAGTLAAAALVFARRESNWAHMLRIPVAALAFVASVIALGSTTSFGRKWTGVADRVNDHLIGGAFEYLARGDFWPGLIFGCILFVVAVFVLAWPAKRRHVIEETVREPVRASEPKEMRMVDKELRIGGEA